MAKTTNIVPEGWTLREAESLYDRLRTPRVYDRNQVNQSGKYPIIDQSESGCIGYLDEIPDFDCSQDMPLTTFANHTCAVRQMKRPFGVIQNVFPLKAKPDVSQHFLYQIINRAIPQNGYKGHYPELRETQFLTPPLPEQQKIATILSSVDNVIEKTRAQIDKLKDLKTGMMQELLTKGIGHTEFKDSPVGRIPTAWKVMPLGSICDLEVGYAFKSSWFSDSGVRLLRGDNVGYGQPTWERIHYLPEEQSKTYSKYLLAAGDVIIGMDRTFTKSGVKVTKLRESDAPALLVQRVGKFLPKKCTKEFLWQLVRSPNFTKALKNQEKGMDIPHLSKTEILEPTVAVPSLGEQADIAKILDSQDVVLDRKQKKLTHLEQIKKALMQDLLTGKVRVKTQKDMLKNVE